MDSIIVEQDSVIKNDSAVRYAYINLLNVANAQTQEYKERYKIAKFNDKIKVGIGATIIVALLYAFITK